MKRRVAWIFAAAATLAACTVGPQYPAPRTSVPAAFGAIPKDDAAAAQGPPVAAWWTTFHDRDARLAGRARGARQPRPATRAGPRPRGARRRARSSPRDRLSDGRTRRGDATRSRRARHARRLPRRPRRTCSRRASTRRGRSTCSAARAARSRPPTRTSPRPIEDRRDVLVTLLGGGRAQLRRAARRAASGVDRARRTSRRSRRRSTLRARASPRGSRRDLDVARAEAQVRRPRRRSRRSTRSRAQSIHALGVLLAEPPRRARVRALAARPSRSVRRRGCPWDCPSDLLRRRPDVRRAERRLAAATARIGVATADYFPRFSLTGARRTRERRPRQSRRRRQPHRVPRAARSRGRSSTSAAIRGNIDAADAREEQAAAAYEIDGARELCATSRTRCVALANERDPPRFARGGGGGLAPRRRARDHALDRPAARTSSPCCRRSATSSPRRTRSCGATARGVRPRRPLQGARRRLGDRGEGRRPGRARRGRRARLRRLRRGAGAGRGAPVTRDRGRRRGRRRGARRSDPGHASGRRRPRGSTDGDPRRDRMKRKTLFLTLLVVAAAAAAGAWRWRAGRDGAGPRELVLSETSICGR